MKEQERKKHLNTIMNAVVIAHSITVNSTVGDRREIVRGHTEDLMDLRDFVNKAEVGRGFTSEEIEKYTKVLYEAAKFMDEFYMSNKIQHPGHFLRKLAAKIKELELK